MKTQEEIDELYHKLYDISLDGEDTLHYYSFVEGYTQCQEDMDKKYTEEDLRKAFKYGIEMEAGIESFDYKNYPDGFSQFINSLNKQE
ncbi:MAG: hypothetical protein ACOVJ5_00415 [Gloeomargaritales cyanobacterium]